MVKNLIAVATFLILTASCSSNNADEAGENQSKTDNNPKTNTEMSIESIVEELTEGKDLSRLSYIHGVATAQQLLREKLDFLDANKFANEVEAFHNGSKNPLNKQEASASLQAIAQETNNFEKLEDKHQEPLINGIASLYYTLFIDDLAFSDLDIDQFKKGLTEYWENQTVENEQQLAEEYFTYKGTFAKEVGEKYLANNAKREGIKVTDSGLQYEVLKEGEGASPVDTNEVTVHYEGKLIDGSIFDSSYERGETISFGLGQVIPGWTEGLQLMSPGAKYRLYIPYNLGYGEQGNQGIPPYATLIFEVELFSFK